MSRSEPKKSNRNMFMSISRPEKSLSANETDRDILILQHEKSLSALDIFQAIKNESEKKAVSTLEELNEIIHNEIEKLIMFSAFSFKASSDKLNILKSLKISFEGHQEKTIKESKINPIIPEIINELKTYCDAYEEEQARALIRGPFGQI